MSLVARLARGTLSRWKRRDDRDQPTPVRDHRGGGHTSADGRFRASPAGFKTDRGAFAVRRDRAESPLTCGFASLRFPSVPWFPANCGPNVAPLEPIGRRSLAGSGWSRPKGRYSGDPCRQYFVTELASRGGCFGFLKAKISAQGKREDAPWDAIDVTAACNLISRARMT